MSMAGGTVTAAVPIRLSVRLLGAFAGSGSEGSGGGRYKPAVTGLAVLCFYGAGEGRKSKKYGKTVRRGLEYLGKCQADDGTFPDRNYTQAICTMALAEAYVMDGGKEVRDAAGRGVRVLLQRQCPAGGWDYVGPGARNDMSVSGWVVMALKAADVAKIAGAKDAYAKFRGLIDATIGKRVGGWYSVMGHARVGGLQQANAMHAVTMLFRLFMGEHDTAALTDGAKIMAQRLPQWGTRHTYRFYYATLALFQIGGAPWKTWNDRVSKMLLENQHKKGDEAGSWDPDSNYDVGRAFSTCLCCLSLEVYYRYAAIYR